MTPQQIAECAEREKAASKGPWTCEPRNVCFYDNTPGDGYLTLKPQTNELYLNESNQNGDCLGAYVNGPAEAMRGDFTVRDAWFVANARQDIPALLKHIESLEREVEALRKGLWCNIAEDIERVERDANTIRTAREGEGEK